jgi:hypothetical protein
MFTRITPAMLQRGQELSFIPVGTIHKVAPFSTWNVTFVMLTVFFCYAASYSV